MFCKICGHQSKKIFSATILKKYKVDYFYCDHCGFLQTQEPFWLSEAYQDPISITDTGLLARNISLSKITAVLIYFLFDKNKSCLDFAGGYGTFTRLMRDYGFDYYWHDLYTPNIFAKGFEYHKNIQQRFELISSFECFEHLPDPLQEIQTMLAICPTILFTTDLLPNPVPQPSQWWYYACDQGQHISFYTHKTLQYIAQQYQVHFYSHWGIHLLSRKEISFFAFKKLIEHHHRLFGFVVKCMKSKTTSDSQQL